MNPQQALMVDGCFDEGQYVYGIDALDQFRTNRARPRPCVFQIQSILLSLPNLFLVLTSANSYISHCTELLLDKTARTRASRKQSIYVQHRTLLLQKLMLRRRLQRHPSSPRPKPARLLGSSCPLSLARFLRRVFCVLFLATHCRKRKLRNCLDPLLSISKILIHSTWTSILSSHRKHIYLKVVRIVGIS